MAGDGAGRFGISVVKDVADALAKLAVVVGIAAGLSLYLFEANVKFVAPLQTAPGAVDRSRVIVCERPKANLARVTQPTTTTTTTTGFVHRCVPGFFQAEIDRPMLRERYGERSKSLPFEVETLVNQYNADNERDLVDQYNRTQAELAPVAELCRTAERKERSEYVFGPGFCDGGGPARANEARARFRGRTYERQLVLETRLSNDEAREALELLHSAEFSVGRIVLMNTGRAMATDIRVFAPSGYKVVGTGEEPFALRRGAMLALRFETDRGDPPRTEDRSSGFDVQWQTGKGYVLGGKATVIGVVLLVIAVVAVAVARDLRRAGTST